MDNSRSEFQKYFYNETVKGFILDILYHFSHNKSDDS